ncbi:MAG: zinc ABC transporter substrate-binding protein [Campylobacterales bacterium]
MRFRLGLLFLLLSSSLWAQIKVVATYGYIEALVREIGGERVVVTRLANPRWDPHFVTPKPSYIVKLRNADLLVVNGGELEVGWLPPLIRQSNNPSIHPGSRGYLELARGVTMIDKPLVLSRAHGDVHPDGNPHIHLDPLNIATMAGMMAAKLTEIDPAGSEAYQKRLQQFLARWEQKCAQWQARMKPFWGAAIIEHHALFDYFLRRYGLLKVATIEPLPGISPNAKHIASVIAEGSKRQVKWVLLDLYHSQAEGKIVAGRIGAKAILLGHDVGSTPEQMSLETLFESIVRSFEQ